MRNLKNNKVKSFIISRPFVRLARGVFYNKIFPYLKYSFYFLVLIFLLITIYLAVFKEAQFKIIKNRLAGYSYKIINFDNKVAYNKIKISGNKRTAYEDVSKLISDYLVNNKVANNQEMIENLKNQIQTLPWVDEVVISIAMQDSLNINIKEHQPFAIWQDENRKYIVSKDAKIVVVEDLSGFDDLIILTGQNAYKNVKSLFNILAIDPEISQNVYSATWVGGRRWDIRFADGLLVKLPSNNSGNNMKDAWDSLIKIYNMPGAKIGLRAIDLRIAKKIYLEYDEGTTKELKSL